MDRPWTASAAVRLAAILATAIALDGGAVAAGGPGASAPPIATDAIEVQGTITYRGPRPAAIAVPDAGRERTLVEVNPRNHGLKDAVVWLEGVPADAKGPIRARSPAVMDQEDFFFIPHVLAIQAGQEVLFRNSDAPNHAIQASAAEPRNSFNIVTPPGGQYARRFVTATRPIAIGCPIHAGMAAWVYVFDHRHFTVTDESGRFRLPGVPPGRFILRAQHIDGGLEWRQPVTIGAPGPVDVSFEMSAAVHDARRAPTRK